MVRPTLRGVRQAMDRRPVTAEAMRAGNEWVRDGF